MMNKVRITSSMDVVIHGALSLLFGLVSSGVVAGGQAVLQTGTNTPVIATAGVIGFLAPFLHGFIALVQSPQAAQAVSDVRAEAVAALDSRLSALEHAALDSRLSALEHAALSRLDALEARYPVADSAVRALWAAAQTPVQSQAAPNPTAASLTMPPSALPAPTAQQAFGAQPWAMQQSIPIGAVPPRG